MGPGPNLPGLSVTVWKSKRCVCVCVCLFLFKQRNTETNFCARVESNSVNLDCTPAQEIWTPEFVGVAWNLAQLLWMFLSHT